MFKADFRHNTYDLGILPELLTKGTLILDGVEFSARGSKKLKTFFRLGTNCIGCGLIGQYFALEKVGEFWNLNLYAKKNDEEILFTRDHIIPLSKGGSDGLENSQPLCAPCNSLKANMPETYLEEVREIVATEKKLRRVLDKCETYKNNHKRRIKSLNKKKHLLETKLSFLREVRKSMNMRGPNVSA